MDFPIWYYIENSGRSSYTHRRILLPEGKDPLACVADFVRTLENCSGHTLYGAKRVNRILRMEMVFANLKAEKSSLEHNRVKVFTSIPLTTRLRPRLYVSRPGIA